MVFDILDATGSVVFTSDPSDSRDVELVAELSGTNYIAVRSTGAYGRIGQYTVSAIQVAPGPRVIATDPTGTVLAPELISIRVTFAEAVDGSTFGTADVSLTGPLGPFAASSVTVVPGSGERQFDVAFAPQTTYGEYFLVVGTDIFDPAGNPMNQDQDDIPGEVLDDQFAATIHLGEARVSIDDVTLVEGDVGTTQLEFTVSRTGDPSVEFTVDYDTYSETATGGANPGTAGFTSHTITSAMDGAWSVFATDLDGDGDMDAISGSYYSVVWFDNDGNGNLVERVIANASNISQRSVFAADLDGDGDQDVLSASASDDMITWYENDGNENFVSRTITTTSDQPRSAIAADVDGDGDLDILAASFADDTLAWYENNGSGGFVLRVITNTADGADEIVAVDVDGDGDQDVLAASVLDDTIAWYEKNGSGGFIRHVITNSADGVNSVFGADVDGDGDLDVLSASSSDDTVAWYENDGSENFLAHIITNTANGAWNVSAADLDDDGDMDVLSASLNDDTIAPGIWTATASTMMRPALHRPLSPRPTAFTPSDCG